MSTQEAWTYTMNSAISTKSGVVVFLDLRNDIAVVNRRTTTSEQHSVQRFTRNDAVLTEGDPEVTSSNSLELALEILTPEGSIPLDGYGAFIDVDGTKGWLPDSASSWGNLFASDMTGYEAPYNIPVFVTSQPIGSFAVDREDNIFVSCIDPSETLTNTLTDGDPVSISGVSYPSAFYPVAPI